MLYLILINLKNNCYIYRNECDIVKKLFGDIDLTWKKLIIFAILAAIYTAVMAILPITKNTSFEDITISFEVWVLFGILIIMNSKSSKDSALKCFVFFLISQPLIYLIQVPFNPIGWKIFIYYRYWFYWTLLTIPMGFIGYYMKKDKWWGLLILMPMILLVGSHYTGFLKEIIYDFPHHLLSMIFCIITMIIYPIYIFKDKKIRIIGSTISILIIIILTILSLTGGRFTYNTILFTSDEETGVIFDDKYKIYLEDEKIGKVYIRYDEGLECYVVEADFVKAGKTNLILEDQKGNKTVFEIDVKRDSCDIKKKDQNKSKDKIQGKWIANKENQNVYQISPNKTRGGKEDYYLECNKGSYSLKTKTDNLANAGYSIKKNTVTFYDEGKQILAICKINDNELDCSEKSYYAFKYTKVEN